LFFVIGGEDNQAGIFLKPLQQIIHIHIRVPIVGIPGFGAFAEEGIGFVEKKYHLFCPARFKYF
jgi:hypothetical protein